jgi:hypothetical protein
MSIKLHDARRIWITDPDLTVRVDPFVHMRRLLIEVADDFMVTEAIDDALGLVELIDRPGFFDTQPERPRIEVSCGALEAS